MDLTQNILVLDMESDTALRNANITTLKRKQEIDTYAQNLKEDTLQLFKNQKTEEASELVKKLEQDRQEAMTELEGKMKTFEEEVDIDKLAEYLLSIAKERVCH